MKSLTLLPKLVLFICWSLVVNGTPEDVPNRAGTTVEVEESNDRLEKITEMDGVAALIEQIKAERTGDDKTGPLVADGKPDDDKPDEWDKLWELIEADEALKEEVFAVLNGKTTNSKGEVSRNDVNHNYDLGNFEKKQNNSLLKLQEYLKKRLQKKLFGEDTSSRAGVKAVTDHNVFHKLYSSQIGKNLMVELANYCIHSDPNTGLVPHVKEDIQKARFYRKQNSETINNYAQMKNGTGDRPFDSCVARIGVSCDKGNSYPDVYDQNRSLITKWEAFNNLTTEQRDAIPETKIKIPKPCEISRYMTSVKITLKQLEEYEIENSKLASRASSSHQINHRQKQALDIDSVVNISSGELLNGEGNEFREEATNEAIAAEKCVMDGTEACESYVVKGDESTSIQDEFNLRNLAMQKKIASEILTGEAEEEDLKNYLIEKGMTEENISQLISQIMEQDQVGIMEAYGKVIEGRFQREREALRESLASRLEERKEVDEGDQRALASKAENVKQSIEDSPMQIAQVFQYANIVSSFLRVNKSDGTTSTNTAALTAELENPFNSEADPRAPANQPQDLSALEEFASEQPEKDSEQGSAVLGSSEIDKIQFSISGGTDDDDEQTPR